MLGGKPDPLLRRWHRCRRWTVKDMPCPFRHLGDTEPAEPLGPGASPLDRIIEWYVRDINISRRIGWTHGGPPPWLDKIYTFLSEASRVPATGFKLLEHPHRAPPATGFELLEHPHINDAVQGTLKRMGAEPAFPPLLNMSQFLPETFPTPHGKRPGLFFLEEALTTYLEQFQMRMPELKTGTGLTKGAKVDIAGKGKAPPTGSQRTPSQGIGSRSLKGRAGNPGVTQSNWTEIMQEMVGLVGGQTTGQGGPPPNTVQQGEI